jgi:type 1 glutamine amidotransferase
MKNFAHIVASLNGKLMGADHPIAWTHEPATGGRFFYTEFGHDLRSLSTPYVKKFILEGIKWSAEPAIAEKGKKP